MQLSSNGKLYRWTYQLTPKYNRPVQTSLCRFFWRCFVWMPLFWLVAVSAVGLVIFGLFRLTMLTHGLVWPGAIIAGLTMFLLDRYNHAVRTKITNIGWAIEDVGDRVVNSVFWQGLMTIKGKICPIIRFND